MYSEETIRNAKNIFDYLNTRDKKLNKADIIIGFGHFDMKIPRYCGQLYMGGYATKILFTGGKGAGSADLQVAEGMAFKKELKKAYAEIPENCIIVESESANTSENIQYSENMLKTIDPDFCFQNGIHTAIAVACAYRQKRVWLCMKKLYPAIVVLNEPPYTTFEEEEALFCSKNQDLISLLRGELERIQTYPEKGFIAEENIPVDVMTAYRSLL